MTASVDHMVKAQATAGALTPGHIISLTDDARDLRFQSADGLLEPVSSLIGAWHKGDGTTTTFTVGKLPPNCEVITVHGIVSGTSGTSGTTIAVGISGTTGKYVTATTLTLQTAGVKTITTIPIHETTAQTVLTTFGAAWDTGAKVYIGVRYIKLPPIPA